MSVPSDGAAVPDTSGPSSTTSCVRTLSGARIRAAQRTHVVLCNLLPGVSLMAAPLVAWYRPPTAADVATFAFAWWFTAGLGVSVGFHRHFTHRSFDAARPLRHLLCVAGSMAAQGPLIAWAATHRRHHECSDADGDPHSPHAPAGRSRFRAIWAAHAGWLYDHPMPNPLRYAPDLLADRPLARCSSRYYGWVALGVVLPGLAWGAILGEWPAAVAAAFWAGPVRIAVASQFVWSVNSICHAVGSRPFRTGDRSRNVAALALPTFGEAWHNNHHAFPASARLGLRWWQLDPGWLTLLALRAAGLVSELKVAKPSGLARQD